LVSSMGLTDGIDLDLRRRFWAVAASSSMVCDPPVGGTCLAS
jgi:hypothetical protein